MTIGFNTQDFNKQDFVINSKYDNYFLCETFLAIRSQAENYIS